MRVDADSEVVRGTRWGRGLAVLLPTAVVTALIGGAIVQGALAAGLNFANQPMGLNVGTLQGQGLTAVMGSASVKNDDASTSDIAVLHAGLNSGTLENLCLVIRQDFMGASYTILLTAAGGAASGENLLFDVTSLEGHDAVLTNAILGRSADEAFAAGQSLGGQPGGFALDVSEGDVTLNQVVASAIGAQVLGNLKVPNLSLQLVPGEGTC